MKAGRQHSCRQTFQHALVITIGLYLATFPTTLPAIRKPESKIESIEKFPANRTYLIRNSSDRFAQFASNRERFAFAWKWF